jgi:transcription-repair coupling factor (superfamily II helicase)
LPFPNHLGLLEKHVRLEGFASPERSASAVERRHLEEGTATGDVKVIIGTHALLSKQMQFARLGLIIVDEEHRFGVRHKERLKQLREGVHVLTLTATPIPRTLQLAMTSVRELSLILTPPKGRRPVLTRIVEETSPKLDEALRRGRRRNGRSFYVCPRIADLDAVAWRLAERVPELRVARVHGRLRARELERIPPDVDHAR